MLFKHLLAYVFTYIFIIHCLKNSWHKFPRVSTRIFTRLRSHHLSVIVYCQLDSLFHPPILCIVHHNFLYTIPQTSTILAHFIHTHANLYSLPYRAFSLFPKPISPPVESLYYHNQPVTRRQLFSQLAMVGHTHLSAEVSRSLPLL